MIIHTTYECRKCGYEIEVEVEVNEDDGDLPDACPECGHPTDGRDIVADAMGAAVDAAHDAAKD